LPGAPASPIWLGLLVVLFLDVCVIGLLLRYNLLTLQVRPYLNIANLTNGNRLAQAGFVLTLAALAGLYYLAWRACRTAGLAAVQTGRQPRAMWAVPLGGLLVINLARCGCIRLTPPTCLTILTAGGSRPSTAATRFMRPARYAGDDFFKYVAWPIIPRPMAHCGAAGGGAAACRRRLDQRAGVQSVLAFYAGCLALIASIEPARPERAAGRVPVRPQSICSGTRPPAMATTISSWCSLSYWGCGRCRARITRWALLAGGLIKFIPPLPLPWWSQ
jgi:hypothetical protein